LWLDYDTEGAKGRFRRKADFESGFYSSVMVKFQQSYQKTVRQEGRKAFFRLVLFGADEGSELQSQNSVERFVNATFS
jgi:hypothetical protein